MIIKTIKRCPKCGSLSVADNLAAGRPSYRCSDCGWKGELVLDEDMEN
jgi:predicted RNA-binding Zn-ribbon protein involved in translation (DUF1610 family)